MVKTIKKPSAIEAKDFCETYLYDTFERIEQAEGKIKSVTSYGGICVITFANGKHYKLELSRYDMPVITIDKPFKHEK